MRDQFDGVVINELRRFEAVINEIRKIIAGRDSISQSEREFVRVKYETLKNELRVAQKHGTVGGHKRTQTETESRYFEPAVRNALFALRPPTNSNPITSRWVACLSSAEFEISYYLHRFEKEVSECP